MKKKAISILCLVVLLSGMINNTIRGADVVVPQLSAPPEFNKDAPSRGKMVLLTRGTYLKDGYCGLTKAGIGKLVVTGNTKAVTTVDEVRISISMERWNPDTNGWSQYTFFSKSGYNTNFVEIDERLDVPRGYYYRLITSHFAYTDVGKSYSGEMWMG